MKKLTEDETIDILLLHFEKEGWNVDSYCKGQKRGCDIIVSKGETQLLIEVKGAKAGANSPTKKREHFDGGQIKTHFGRAIIKALEDKTKYPNAIVAIAHPDDASIRSTIGNLIPYLKEMGIKHFWVSEAEVIEQ